MGVRTHDQGPRTVHRGRAVSPGTATLVAFVAFVLVVANGRPLGLALEGGVAGLILQAALGAAGLVVDLDPTSRALVGKWLAALFAASAAGFLFAAVATRWSIAAGRGAGLVLAVGTTLAAAAQCWSGEAAATAAVALALFFLARADADDDPKAASLSSLPLAAAVVLQASCGALALVLGLWALLRFPRSAARSLLFFAPAAAVAVVAFLAAPAPLTVSPGPGPLALLFSPGIGALVFAPVALVGLAGALRAARGGGHRPWDASVAAPPWLPLACATAAIAHLVVIARLGEVAGSAWGPRLAAPAWPPLLLFLPEGLALLRGAGLALAAVSIAVQALFAFASDGRFERLHGPGSEAPRSAWDLLRGPVPFLIQERAMRPALVAFEGGRLVVREYPLVLGGPTGSRVTFGARPIVDGADPTLGDVLLEGGARPGEGRLVLGSPEDALFFRVREGARARRLELRLRGRGEGALVVEEKTFHTTGTREERRVAGAFRLRVPYTYAESGGGDVRIRAEGGTVLLESVSLVPPTEPEDVIRLSAPGTPH